MERPPRFGAPARALCALLSGLLATGVAGPSLAQEGGEGAPGLQRVAVVKMVTEGNIPDAVRELFTRRVSEGLTAVKLEVMDAKDVSAALRMKREDAEDCKDSGCYPKVARALDVSYLVTCKIIESSKTYGVWLEIINGRTGATIASSRERCETCGIEEAAEKVAFAASSLRARLEALAREPARIVIRSTPGRALVSVDGKPAGPTPVDLELGAGQHRVKLMQEGYVPLERTFTVVSGVDETLDLDMTRIPSMFPWATVGWISAAVGALAVAGGIWALQRDGAEVTCTPEQRDGEGDCPEVWSTKAGGAALLGLGVAAASLGGVFIYMGRDRTSTGREEASAGFGYRGRF